MPCKMPIAEYNAAKIASRNSRAKNTAKSFFLEEKIWSLNKKKGRKKNERKIVFRRISEASYHIRIRELGKFELWKINTK